MSPGGSTENNDPKKKGLFGDSCSLLTPLGVPPTPSGVDTPRCRQTFIGHPFELDFINSKKMKINILVKTLDQLNTIEFARINNKVEPEKWTAEAGPTIKSGFQEKSKSYGIRTNFCIFIN